jgi:ABC-type nitrate/sulfonate/bicarbonate transport system permease component
MTEYDRAFADSFLIGLGAGVMNAVWMMFSQGLTPYLVAVLLIPVILFLLPIFLVYLHVDGPLSILGPKH